MDISLKVQGTEKVQWMLAGMQKTQAKKAVTLWTNWVGLEAQGEMRRQIGTRFSFRGTKDGFEKAIVFQQATEGGRKAQKALLKVGGPGGFSGSRTQKLGVILARHEEAETRTESGQTFYDGRGRAMTGLGYFVPANGLRTSSTNPPRSLYPRNIGAAMRRDVDGNYFLAKGTKKGSKAKGSGVSFFATRNGIFKRRHTGFGRADVQAIWWFARRVRTPARLRLWETAEKVFQARAVALGVQAIEETLFRELNQLGEFRTR